LEINFLLIVVFFLQHMQSPPDSPCYPPLPPIGLICYLLMAYLVSAFSLSALPPSSTHPPTSLPKLHQPKTPPPTEHLPVNRIQKYMILHRYHFLTQDTLLLSVLSPLFTLVPFVFSTRSQWHCSTWPAHMRFLKPPFVPHLPILFHALDAAHHPPVH